MEHKTNTFVPVIPEEEIQKMWESNNIFQKSIDQKSESEFVFYDGPPFATGLPHYGHILAGFIKDTIGKFQTMNGKTVPRKAGWDTHGLPIEYEIEKKHNINTKQQIEEWGIHNYNAACKEIVLTYASEWETIMGRLGRWVDFSNDYKTMDFDFMQSVWWVFSQMAQKKLIYPSYKVMPYSVSCKTPLSNFETAQNYQEVEDTTAFVKFKLESDKQFRQFIQCDLGLDLNLNLQQHIDININLLVWTTTPWTLPSNLVIAAGPNIKYTLLESKSNTETETRSEYYIMASSLFPKLFAYAKKSFTILTEFDGKELIGLKYKPLFDSYPIITLSDKSKAFQIIGADFVTDSDGTGLVHIAPSYGEDDYNCCIANGIIKKTDDLFMSIDEEGFFVHGLESLSDIGGMFYKSSSTKTDTKTSKDSKQTDANTQILSKLKASNKLFFQNKYKHNYPFCWRSDTPLMYRAIRSWFVNVEVLKDRMVELNKTINWVPENIGSGRFHNWLSSAKDWCIARSRYWGTPIPIWANVSDPADYIVIESVEQLEKLCKLEPNTITDLHRDKIDHLIFEQNGKTYRRIVDVFDCWFESGSMPYASIGYPFKTKNITFPADFIAEGIDQTRGWFYTLLVISTALFDSVPFKNVVVNGLVLASDGKKMSKRLQNYPDPMVIVRSYGSDALRLYLLSSPATKADTLKFNEGGVSSMVKDIIIPLKNSVNFFSEYVQKYNLENSTNFNDIIFTDQLITSNPLDAYAVKYIGQHIKMITTHLEKYQLSDAVRTLSNVVEMLNNQYIKYNRFSLKGKNTNTDPESWKNSLYVLGYLLQQLMVVVAPIVPFFAEYAYKKISEFGKFGLNLQNQIMPQIMPQIMSQSIHLVKLNDFVRLNISSELNTMADEMIHVLNIIGLVYGIRSKNCISMSLPLEKILIRTSDNIRLIFDKYSNFILDELNVLELESSVFEWSDIGIEARPNFITIKEQFPTNVENISKAINKLRIDQSIELAKSNTIELDQFTIQPNMVNLIIKPNSITDHISDFAHINGNNYCVYLNNIVSDRVRYLAYARTIATKFQKMRKEAGLHSWDKVILAYDGTPEYDVQNELICNAFYKICNCNLVKSYSIDSSTQHIFQSKLYSIDSDHYNSEYNIDMYLYNINLPIISTSVNDNTEQIIYDKLNMLQREENENIYTK
jgi:isoleucyl-tRNA synthetase